MADDYLTGNWGNLSDDPYASLPEPDYLKTACLVDFSHGDFHFEILCTACTVRTLPCAISGKTTEWFHCKAVQRAVASSCQSCPSQTLLFPCKYITRICPGPEFSIEEAKPTEDIAFFSADKPDPESSIPIFEVHGALRACRGELVAAPPSGFMYNDFVSKISERFESALKEIDAVFNFDHGPEFEIAICKTLQRILPQKFGICRGFVVNSRGDIQGDDIIIFDRMRFPTIRSLGEESYATKEQVPIEAVYAYIEAKHTLEIEGDENSSMTKAILQVSWVKLLCVRRKAVPLSQIAPFIDVTNPASIAPLPGWPGIRNPIYGAVFARQVRVKRGGSVLTDPEVIQKHLLEVALKCEIPPDLIVAGKNNLLIPALPTERKGESQTPSPFHLGPHVKGAHMNPVVVDGIAFGAGLSFLLWALDWIQLGDMPWPQILKNCTPPQKQKL